MKILEVKDLYKSFKNTEVLKGISFDMEDGEVLAIIGSSGSGKSTLLRCLNFLERADRGSIAVSGKVIVAADETGKSVYPDEKAMRKEALSFGLVFQDFNLFPHLSVMANLTLSPMLVDGATKEEAKELAYTLLKKVGLEEKADAYPQQLSGGQKQRVAIARALAMKPDILCFDEPTSALDPELTGEVLKVIRSLKEDGATMIVVTHEMNFARDVADKIAFMEEGIIAEYGDAKEVYYHPKNQRTKEFMGKIM